MNYHWLPSVHIIENSAWLYNMMRFLIEVAMGCSGPPYRSAIAAVLQVLGAVVAVDYLTIPP